MQIVHHSIAYESVAEAAQQPDGLAVLGFFFKVVGQDNMVLKRITDKLKMVQEEGGLYGLEQLMLLLGVADEVSISLCFQ